ncbi:AAA family ATPase [Enterobacter sp. Bisph1]|uniref:trifunctional serine/threonine-protein kinase/ATP-binding protein/sensor histidine kinase n=1 Tax=Enterobacter sp. Bisph1 TaxID=1274399 RepID=UPI00057C24F2|nr:AAA family ATPase [Enterobacter sp. Bisph1]
MTEQALPNWPRLVGENQPFTLQDGAIYTPLAQEGSIIWMNAHYPWASDAFILATAVSDDAEPSASLLLNHELTLCPHLDSAWAIKPVASTQYHGRMALVYPFFTFKPLTRLTGQPVPSVDDWLELTLRICAPLRQMHRHNLIHGDIKPGNIFLSDDGCRLGGFGLTTSTAGELAQSWLPAAGGTLAYMSPEHTARTHHAVDSRSDLYSLGIVLYELLTGTRPFDLSEGGQAEWVLHHIASEPAAPHLSRAGLPEMLSTIVLKLLAKSPDKRYQTVDGLIADLRRCQATLSREGDIAPFTPGLQDRSPGLHFANTLYRAHPQAKELAQALDAVVQSGTQTLVTLSGPTGMGKSSLMASSLKAFHTRPTLIALGKVEQNASVMPLGVLSRAFRSLVLHLLGLPAEEVARWKVRLNNALAGYESLAVSFVPELGLLIDAKSGAAAETLSLDTRARFNAMMLRLINVLATPGCPLIILIDNLHWIDDASLQLLEYLLQHSHAVPLLMVVSHQDLASLEDATFAAALTRLCSAANRVITCVPQPLSTKAIARWLAAIFQTRTASIADLAKLVHEKTGGNPLYVHEFSKRIIEEGLVTHSSHQGKWQYDLQTISARYYSENMPDLLLQQLVHMPPETQSLLGCMACLGSAGDIPLLSRVLGCDKSEIGYRLHPAVALHLITLNADAYTFFHERIYEAARALLTPEHRRQLHLTTATLLAQTAEQAPGNEVLFRTLHHMAEAAEAIEAIPQTQRQRFIELSLLAARRAKRTGDYASALNYLHQAKRLDNADTPCDFARSLEETACEFLLGNLATARGLCERLLASPGGLAEKAQAATLLAEVHIRQSGYQLALETTLGWLTVFGIDIHRYADEAECDAAWQAIYARIGDNPSRLFMALPRMNHQETDALMNLLASASLYASFICPRLHFLLLCQMLNLTLERGLTGASTPALAWFGVLLGERYEEYELGFRYGALAQELVKRHELQGFAAKTLLAVGRSSVWTQPLSRSVECANACFTAAVANGDLTIACIATFRQVVNSLSRGDHLDTVRDAIDRALAFVRATGFSDMDHILLLQRHFVEYLRQPEGMFSDDEILPHELLPQKPPATIHFWFWLYMGMARFLSGAYVQAEQCLQKAGIHLWSAPGHISQLDYHLYSALALSMQLTPETFSAEHRLRLNEHYNKIARWARVNPGTFSDKEALVYAEIVRLDGMNSIALEQYEKAIRLSREGGFNPSNGLAHELAGRFALSCGFQTAADAYFRGAMAAWGRTGAQAKVRHLQHEHPHLFTPGESTPYDTIAFAQNDEIRDLQSIIKASRALSEEINLERLIQILMTMLLERAGAQRGLLIRVLDDNIPEIEASAHSSHEGVIVRVLKEIPTATDMPLSVLAAVIRTGQEIRTGRPEEYSPFSQDAYLISSGAAVMCVPMFKQARLVGVLYLENRLMPEMFTAGQSRVVNLLGAHAAVSLETARLYTKLVEENVQRRRVEKELRASQTSLMLGEQISHTGTWRWELAQDLMHMSDEYARILGIDEERELISMAEFLTFVHPDDHPHISALVTRSVAQGLTMQAEFRIIRSDGACRYILGIGDPVCTGDEVHEYFGTITDITAQRQSEDAARIAQAELARVSRATTVGQLTSSIAHEINQPLMSIVSNAGASLRWLNRSPIPVDNVRVGLEEIISEGQRAGEVIRSLQALTRRQEPVFERIDLHFLLRHIMTLSRSELARRDIAVEYALDADNPFIYGDSVQIQQVLLNLVMNAVEAMAEIDSRPRVLTLSTLSPGPQEVICQIADTGSGMDAAVQSRLFESFYTTKTQGMGMGLTISHAIIERHNGTLSAQSRLPFGSVFAFTLPLAED